MRTAKGSDRPYVRTKDTGRLPRNPEEGWERAKNARAAAAAEDYYKNHHRPVSARIEWMHLHDGKNPYGPNEATKRKQKARITLPKVWR